MAVDEEKRIAFDREKAVFEQNCGQLRTLIPELHKKPLMSATLTGALLTAMSVFRLEPKYAVGLFALIAVMNAFIAISCLRLRDVIESYIEKASLFSPDFGAKGGRPSKSVMPWFGGFSIAFGYAFMMGTIVIAACLGPFLLFCWAFTSFIPALTTALGVGAWAWFTHRRRVADEKDQTIAYYDANWKDYVAKTQGIDMSDILDRFVKYLPAGARILDVGAGAGRDSMFLLSRHYKVVALDPSPKMANVLRAIPGLDVVEHGAEQIEDVAQYDGVWACASLLHLDDRTLTVAMQRLARALKPGGVLYMCFKDGDSIRRISDGRLFHDLSADGVTQLAKAQGLTIEESWRTASKLIETNAADWNNVIARRPS